MELNYINNKYYSNWEIVGCGVPQGSVLGPLLFLLYINDLTENVQGAKLVLYTDDTNLLINGKDELDLQHKIINIMKELEIWFQKNNLIINTKKTSAMSFHPKQWRDPLRPQIFFNNTEIVYQSELRLLGIHMTETLKWCAHAQFLKAKLCKVIYMVKILKEIMSPYMIKIIYFSNFESYMRNGILLWGGDGESKSIFKLQKQVLRVISGTSSRTSCRQIFKDYNVLTLPSLYILEVTCFIKKYKAFMAINSDIHNYNTRRKLNFHVQHCNTALFKRSVINMGISLYNKVPNQIK